MPRFPSLAGLRVLVVDDDPDLRELYESAIPRHVDGAQVSTASGGAEALACIAQSLPDVVIMDIAMPLMDGLEATRRLRSDSRTAPLPIVALTGSFWDSQKVLDAGCDGYLTKPCFVEDLLVEVVRLFARRGLRPRAFPS